MKIGAFDSGKGGTTIMNAVKTLLPNEEYFYIADAKNCPYGEKTDQELYRIVTKNVNTLIDWGADIIVIACNTATTRCLDRLRQDYPNINFVGTEPAIKLATNSDAKNILVLATPGTIKSERLTKLVIENKHSEQNVQLLPCPGLADTIEVYLDTQDSGKIDDKLQELLINIKNPDTIVLGCTHYSLVKNRIATLFPTATIIDGNHIVAQRVADLALSVKNRTHMVGAVSN